MPFVLQSKLTKQPYPPHQKERNSMNSSFVLKTTLCALSVFSGNTQSTPSHNDTPLDNVCLRVKPRTCHNNTEHMQDSWQRKAVLQTLLTTIRCCAPGVVVKQDPNFYYNMTINQDEALAHGLTARLRPGPHCVSLVECQIDAIFDFGSSKSS